MLKINEKNGGTLMYLVIGGTGFLGSYIVSEVKKLTRENIVIVSRTCGGGDIKHIRCDVSKKYDLDDLISFINAIREPCKIIYLSACHNPEQVESDPWMSWNTNVMALDYLISKLNKNLVFIFASTDAVYGDSQDGYRYTENDSPSPVSMYGIQKSAGEMVVAHYGGHSFRYALLAGASMSVGRRHFWDTVIDSLKSGVPIKLFSDAFRCMLDFETAACLTIQLIEEHAWQLPPVVNICGDEELSKYDVGMRLARKYELPENLIIPIKMAEDNGIFRTRRALSILMDNARLKSMLSQESILISL